MNEQMLFQKMDYTKNPNLVFEENTLYEMDPDCMKQKERENLGASGVNTQQDRIRRQETEAYSTESEVAFEEEDFLSEADLFTEQDETVTNAYFQGEINNGEVNNRGRRFGIWWWVLIILLIQLK